MANVSVKGLNEDLLVILYFASNCCKTSWFIYCVHRVHIVLRNKYFIQKQNVLYLNKVYSDIFYLNKAVLLFMQLLFIWLYNTQHFSLICARLYHNCFLFFFFCFFCFCVKFEYGFSHCDWLNSITNFISF